MRYRTISINLFVPAHARENARTRRHIICVYAHASSAKELSTIKEFRGERF